jgi:hypothetical protein
MRLHPEHATGMKISICRSGSPEAKIGAEYGIEIEPSTLQVMPSAFDDNHSVRSGDRGQGVLHLRNRSERVLGPWTNSDRVRSSEKWADRSSMGFPGGCSG